MKTSAEQLILKVNFVTVKIFILDMGMKDTVPNVGMDAVNILGLGRQQTLDIPKYPRMKRLAQVPPVLLQRKRSLTIKLSKGPGLSAGLQKTWRDTTTSSQPSGSQARQSTTTTSGVSNFCVASVGILICGVDRHGAIRVLKAPSKNGMNEIQAMKNCRCYVDEQVTFYHDWSYARSAAGQEEKPPWRLLNKSGQVLTVVDIACLTGTDLAKHKGRDKASVTESHLWFGTIFHTSSDSEADNDGSEMELLSDVDSIGDDTNHNPELASSLMEMELSDSGDFHTDYKGKGKLKILKTPMVNELTIAYLAKHTHTALSPDESLTNLRVALKKLKSETAAIPLFLPSQSSPSLTDSWLSIPSVPATYATCPELSHPATIVPMSEDDILWHNQPQPDNPFAPVIVNPWESEYVIRPVDYLF
ncbi:uncharacterized protein BJ212DRAFT_1533550 [Suillus subaureus]|uniref:Uncharacterized protein n=1 Tax=Suillus subaureus TaxID=48587 RepID=A0A9P7EK28_9AGAM|nr:uncharacterized protein BJ212DRAFT_1533550 [Suillus subaureus]KAG1823746.1 hypothetical protein BJ212DRAFT_1533550 [Suillus subaureus]